MTNKPKTKKGVMELILDSSAIINLLGSNAVDDIISMTSKRCVITKQVFNEITRFPSCSYQDEELLSPFIDSGLIEVIQLSGKELTDYFELVGPKYDLDDGEASTIALAQTLNYSAVIDERKAMRICNDHFPEFGCFPSIYLFQIYYQKVNLAQTCIREHLFKTITTARMRIPFQYRPWVEEILGKDLIMQCPSLKKYN